MHLVVVRLDEGLLQSEGADGLEAVEGLGERRHDRGPRGLRLGSELVLELLVLGLWLGFGLVIVFDVFWHVCVNLFAPTTTHNTQRAVGLGKGKG